MTYRIKITMDNGQSTIIRVSSNDSRSKLVEELTSISGSSVSRDNQFISAETEDGTYFTYCVGKLSTLEFLN